MPLHAVTPAPELATVRAASSPAATAFHAGAAPDAELARQVQVYVDLGFPALLELTEDAFRERLEPLRGLAPEIAPATAGVPEDDHVPFVLVLGSGTAAANDRVPAMRRGVEQGVSVIDEAEVRSYRAIEGVSVPDAPAYLLTGIDVGSTLLDVRPADALDEILRRGRTPLTIDEGLALVTVRPDMLRPNRCFSLAGSRTGTNQRVPAIWISRRRPKLGWCWDRNPHTWLGTASAGERRPPPAG